MKFIHSFLFHLGLISIGSVLFIPFFKSFEHVKSENHQKQKSHSTLQRSKVNTNESNKLDLSHLEANQVYKLNNYVRFIFQDNSHNYWFGTDAGAYLLTNEKLYLFDTSDGLIQNQIRKIQQDKQGKIWFETGGFGVNCWIQNHFINRSGHLESNSSIKPHWQLNRNDLWFCAGGGVYQLNQNTLYYLPFPTENVDVYPNTKLSKQSVYSIARDKYGNMWFGTQALGVYCFNGSMFRWFTDHGLMGPAVLAILEDKSGNMWFGTNGSGLFKFDGERLINISRDFDIKKQNNLVKNKSDQSNLLHVWSLCEDKKGNIWIGTGDSGIWCFDGTECIHYNERNGLPACGIETIFCDHYGKLWIGTNGSGVFIFNDPKFQKYTPVLN